LEISRRWLDSSLRGFDGGRRAAEKIDFVAYGKGQVKVDWVTGPLDGNLLLVGDSGEALR